MLKHGINLQCLNVVHILAFVEFLAKNSCTAGTISNYLSGIKAKFIQMGWSVTLFEHPQIRLCVKAMQMLAPLKPKVTGIFYHELLLKLVALCDNTHQPPAFKALYLLSFFFMLSMLRLASILPHSRATFSPHLHLTRGDIFLSTSGIQLLVKVTKT